MKWEFKGTLRFGSNVIELLLPQRRPFVMVDFVDSFYATPVPTLDAGRHISANEHYFAGHFPGLHVWPGSLTIEGLGQTGALLMTILRMRRAAEEEGVDPDTIGDALRNLDLGFRLHPGYRADAAAAFLAKLRTRMSGLSVGASVEMKFLRPVFAGQRLDYRVRLTHEIGDATRFAAEACVEGVVVAAGVMTGSHVPRAVGPGGAPS